MIFCCCKFCVNLAPLTVNFRACQHEIFYNILIAHNVKQAQYTILLFVLQYSAVCVCLPLAFSVFSFYLSLSLSLFHAPVSRHRWMITRYIVHTVHHPKVGGWPTHKTFPGEAILFCSTVNEFFWLPNVDPFQ